MSKSAIPDWVLGDTWAVSRDKYNWVLQTRKGDRWRAVSYHPSPELLLKSLHRKISRTMPVERDLLNHMKTAYKAGERLSDQLSNHINASLGSMAKLTPQQAAAIKKEKVSFVGNGVMGAGTG